jgi:hypothetical protein
MSARSERAGNFGGRGKCPSNSGLEFRLIQGLVKIWDASHLLWVSKRMVSCTYPFADYFIVNTDVTHKSFSKGVMCRQAYLYLGTE